MNFCFYDIINVIIILLTMLLVILLMYLFTSFKEEDNSDNKSVNSGSSSQSKENRKNYLTRMNTIINELMLEKLPDLKLQTYIKIQNEYRNQFKKKIIQNIRNYRKSFHTIKRVTFNEENIVEEEKEFEI